MKKSDLFRALQARFDATVSITSWSRRRLWHKADTELWFQIARPAGSESIQWRSSRTISRMMCCRV